MCIAIFCPKNIRPTKAVLRQCFENNPDGAGYAFASGGKVLIRKGFYTWRSFWDDFREHCPISGSALIHFRIATSGQIDGQNCHPFRITDSHALIHNGNLSGKLGLDCDTLSDTGLFVANIMRPTLLKSPKLLHNKAFQYFITETIGYANKVLVLDGKDNVTIFNEKAGEWNKGSWFSNKSYTTEKVHRPSSSITVCKFNNGKAISTQSFAHKKDIIFEKPCKYFWTRRLESVEKGTNTKKKDFYNRMSDRNRVSHENAPTDLDKSTLNTTEGDFQSHKWSCLI